MSNTDVSEAESYAERFAAGIRNKFKSFCDEDGEK